MLFSHLFIIKLYRDGQAEPFIVFTIESLNTTKIDDHTIRSDGSIIKFDDNVFVTVDE